MFVPPVTANGAEADESCRPGSGRRPRLAPVATEVPLGEVPTVNLDERVKASERGDHDSRRLPRETPLAGVGSTAPMEPPADPRLQVQRPDHDPCRRDGRHDVQTGRGDLRPEAEPQRLAAGVHAPGENGDKSRHDGDEDERQDDRRLGRMRRNLVCQSRTEAPSHADRPTSTAVRTTSNRTSTPAVAATAAGDALRSCPSSTPRGRRRRRAWAGRSPRRSSPGRRRRRPRQRTFASGKDAASMFR